MIYQHEIKEAKREPNTGIISEPPPVPFLSQEDPSPWQTMRDYLDTRGISFANARYNGCYPILRKGLRMYIPAVTRIEGHHYWQARSLDGNQLRYDSPFGPRRDALVVAKNLARVRDLASVAVVEGPLDALAVSEVEGFVGIGLMGIRPNEEALVHLLSHLDFQKPRVILLIADRDSVGEMAKIQGWLAMRGYPSELRVPQGFKDVCEGTVEQRKELLKI